MKHLLIITAILFTLGCSKKEGCTDRNASNYDSDAEKENGNCIFSTSSLMGDYAVTKTCSNGNSSICMTVSQGATNTIIISFNDCAGTLINEFNATVTGHGVLTIPLQHFAYAHGSTSDFSGSGTYSDVQIKLSTTELFAGNKFTCSWVALKQ